MSISNSKKSNSTHWDKIFKHAYNHKRNYKSENHDFFTAYRINKYQMSGSSNETISTNSYSTHNNEEHNDFINSVNFTDIYLLEKENSKYFCKTEKIINLARDAYNGILLEISNFKMKLIEMNNSLGNRSDFENDCDIEIKHKAYLSIKKNYDNLIEFVYFNLKNYTDMYLENENGEKFYAIYQIDHSKKNIVRNIMLTYIGSGGVVIDDCITKVDNICLKNLPEKLFLQIGKFNFQVKKSEYIKDFSILKLREKILDILNNIYLVEKEIDKNIKILGHSLNIIKVIKNNLHINN